MLLKPTCFTAQINLSKLSIHKSLSAAMSGVFRELIQAISRVIAKAFIEKVLEFRRLYIWSPALHLSEDVSFGCYRIDFRIIATPSLRTYSQDWNSSFSVFEQPIYKIQPACPDKIIPGTFFVVSPGDWLYGPAQNPIVLGNFAYRSLVYSLIRFFSATCFINFNGAEFRRNLDTSAVFALESSNFAFYPPVLEIFSFPNGNDVVVYSPLLIDSWPGPSIFANVPAEERYPSLFAPGVVLRAVVSDLSGFNFSEVLSPGGTLSEKDVTKIASTLKDILNLLGSE